MRRNLFALVETREILPGVVSNRRCRRCGQRLPFLARRQFVIRELDLLCLTLQGTIHRCESALRKPPGLRAEISPVLFHQLHRAARIRILIGAATERGQRDRARKLALQRLLRATGPVAMDLINADGGAMTGVAREDRPHLAVGTRDAQHRQIVINRLQTKGPSIGRETHLADSPCQRGWLAIRECGECGFFDVVREFPRVALDGRQMLRRDVHAEQIRQYANQHRGAVRVAGADRETLTGHLALCGEAAQHFFTHRSRHSDIVHRHQHRRALLITADRQGLGKDVL